MDKDSGELLFIMNTPLVYDANGDETGAAVRLTPCATYTRMEYVIDDDFLASAAWPVTIDPTTMYAKSRQNILESGLYRTEAPDTPHYNKRDYNCGNRGAYEYITLIRFKELIKQKSSDTIVSAVIGMHPTSSLDVTEYMACYPMKQSWEPETATWNNIFPDTTDYISDKVISYVDTTGSTCYFNITDLYRSWYKKGTNFGVAFRYPLGVDGAKHYVQWAGVQRNSENGPCVIVNYLSHAGLESWWEYESMGAGQVGTAHVDLFNGNMVFEHADVAMSGSRMPVSVSHYYNSCLATSNEHGCGMGWRMSVNQSLHKTSLKNVNWIATNYYVWTDGDGTEHYFKASGSAPYKDEETNTLKLTLSGGVAIITTKDDTQLKFPQPSDATRKYITSIEDACGNIAKYTYDDAGMLTKVTDGADRDMSFTYTNGLLTEIKAPDKRVVRLTYDAANQLISIQHPDTGTANFSYTNGLLTLAENADGELGGTGVQIGYQDPDSLEMDSVGENPTSSTDYVESCRVTSMMQTGIENCGAMLCFEYLTGMTRVKSLKEGNTAASEGKTLTYQFNENGNLTCVFDELGYGKRADFDSYNAETESSRLQKAVINYAQNLAFDVTSSNWTQVKENDADALAQDATVRCLSMPSLKIVKNGAGEALARQVLTGLEDGMYTFSAYVRADNLSGGNAFLRIASGDAGAGSIQVQGSTNDANCGPAAEGWERVYAGVNVSGGSATLELVCDAIDGTAYFACPQLERGELANRVNLLTNGDFSRTEVNTDNAEENRLFPMDWSAADGITDDRLNCVLTNVAAGTDGTEGHGMPTFLSGNALRMTSYPAKSDVGFNQEVPVSGAKGDVYVVGGWVNSNSVYSGSTNSSPCIAYRFTGGKSDGKWKYAEFNREWVGWQFGAWAIAAPETYTGFTFSVNYARNAQTAMFSNMFMYREQFGQSFEYDSNKNLVSTANLSGEKSEMKYDAYDNLISYVQPGADKADKYAMTYGSTTAEKKRHLLRTSTTPMGVKQEFTYDDFGNAVMSKTVNGTTSAIGSKTEYDEKQNYPVKSYDARGNAVTRSINPNDYTLTSVTDPDGQTVSYAYDAAKRVTGVETTAGTGEEAVAYKNAYTYENNRIKTVAHNTTGDECDVVYRFEYDALGRKTSVKVGNAAGQNQPLSTNSYSNDRSGLLKEVQYGNGGKVKYAYDDFDRLEGVAYDDEENPRYSYIYDASGEVAKVVDNHLNRALETERDLAFRPRQSTLRDANGDVLYRTTLYYDKMNRLEKFAEKVNGEAHTSAYTYDKDNRTTEIRYDYTEPEGEETEAAPCHKVTYAYDALGRIEKRIASVGDHSYETSYAFEAGASNSYGSGATTPLVKTITQGTGENAMNFEYAYDNRGNIISEKRNGLTTTYAYDALGQLIRVDDPHENATWVYSYDRGGNILSKAKYAYTTGALGTAVETIPYTYGDANWKDKLTAYNGVPITYDAIGNPLNDGTRTYTWSAGRQLRHISILTGEAHGFRANNGVHEGSNTLLRIVYDEASSKLKVKLLRDGREITDKCAASAFVWTKNGAAAGTGREIAVTETEVNGDAQFGCAYTETQGVYGTVSVDNNLVASHDPAATDACHVFTLENGMLKVEAPDNAGSSADYELNDGALSINPGFTGTIAAAYEFTTTPTREIEFKYDHNGLRTQKKVVENGITTTYDYTLHGKLITHMTKRNVEADNSETIQNLHFFYDAQSKPAFVEYNGTMYRYVHNLQGDIVGIIDNSGNLVVEYKYDAWGKPLSITGTLKTTLGEYNPFRYRGYVWDEETRLYYLRSRYYNPTISRFICEDTCVISAQKVGGINMFAYCVNRPILGYDPMGKRYIDALSVQHEIKKQRELALEYTKQTRPQKASQSVVKEIDRYLSNRNFDRLTDVYVYQVGKQEYYSTIIGGMWYKKRFQYLPKYEHFKAIFKINTYEWISTSDLISYINDIAGVYLNNMGAMPYPQQQQDIYSYLGSCSDTIGYQMNNMAFEDWMNEPIYTWDSTELVSCTIISYEMK